MRSAAAVASVTISVVSVVSVLAALTACTASTDSVVDSAVDPVSDAAFDPDSVPTDGPGARTTIDRAGATAAALDVRADGCGPRVGFGSGAVIDDGLAVTAAHVVAGSDEVEVIDTMGTRAAATVVHFDPDLDLALLRLDAPAGEPIAVRPTQVAAGEPAVVVLPRWTADELDVEVVDVVVTRTVNISTTDIYLRDEVDRAGFEIEGAIDPGDSGALVVAEGGGVGVVWARSRLAEQRAWVVDLPAIVVDPARRATAVDPVDTGDCIR